MPRRFRSTTLGAFAALALVIAPSACSSSSSGSSGNNTSAPNPDGVPTGPSMSSDAFCEARAKQDSAWCTYLDKCCSAADKTDLWYLPPACAFGPTDPQKCKDQIGKLTSAGAMVFHGEYAQACLDELAKWVPPAPASCSGTHVSDHLLTGHERPAFAQISACRLTEQGQLMNGAGCEYDSQCSDGLRCRSYAGSSTDFRCQPLRKLHEPCGLQSDCDTSLACIGDTGLAACDTLHDTGESCIFTSDCKDGLLCANKTCITPPTSGAACGSQDGYSCAPLLGCSLNSQRCVSLGSTGASCSASTQCEGRCDSTTMKCVSICGGTW